jgi:hypothetical protein
MGREKAVKVGCSAGGEEEEDEEEVDGCDVFFGGVFVKEERERVWCVLSLCTTSLETSGDAEATVHAWGSWCK